MQISSIKQALVKNKKLVLSSIWGVTLIAWLGLACLGFMKPTIETWVTAVTVVAVLTELAFWSTALIFGVSIWDSRKRVFAFIFPRK